MLLKFRLNLAAQHIAYAHTRIFHKPLLYHFEAEVVFFSEYIESSITILTTF